jgi:tetratricopeptide (TPR) repeat protein
MSSRALALDLAGRAPEATEEALAAAEIARSIPELRATERARLLHNAAMALTIADRADEALPLAEESLAIRESHFGKGHPATTPGRSQLALTLRALGRIDEAIALQEATIASLDGVTPEALQHRGNARRHLARSLEMRNATGDREAANEALRLALIEFGRSNSTYASPMNTAARNLLRTTAAGQGMEATIEFARVFGDELAGLTGNPVAGAVLRSELPGEIERSLRDRTWIPSPEWIARFRADVDAVARERSATDESAIRVELGLCNALLMTGSDADRQEARTRVELLHRIAVDNFGERSNLAASCDALRMR